MSGAAGSSQWMYASGYTAENSLKFNDDDASYLTRTPATAGNRKTFTFSAWVKRSNISVQQTLMSVNSANNNSGILHIYLASDDEITISFQAFTLTTTPLLRDTAAWYHIMFVADTTQAAEANRFKIFLNGDQLTLGSSGTFIAQNTDLAFCQATEHNIGRRDGDADRYFDGYLAEVNFIDGTALTPASFISTGAHGKILPKKYGGAFGTTGFYLPFKMDYEVEGFNAINWDGRSLANFDEFYIGGVGFEPDVIWTKSLEGTQDHFFFTRHNGVGALAPVRPNQINGAGMPNHAYDFLNEFNTDGYTVRGGQFASAYLVLNSDFITWAWDMGGAAAGHYLYPKTFTAGGQAHISTDRYKFGSSALQLDGNGDYFKTGWNNNFNHYRREFTIEYWINMEDDPNSTQHGHLGQEEGDNYWRINHNSSRIEVQCEVGGNTQWNFNTSGHGTQIDTANQWYHIALVKQGSRVILYLNGSEAGRQEMADGDFKWIEADLYLGNYNGSASSWFKGWMDEIRISRVARYTGNFTVASAAYSNDKDTILLIHAEGSDNSTTLTDSSGAPVNTDGSGTSYVSANDTYGQSLISYVGTGGAKTLGHGLSAAPEVILVKNRSSNQEWLMYHANNTAAPQTDYLRLDTTAATADNTFWNDTAPTSSVFSVGDSQPVNSSHGNEYVALAFRSVTGYSKFGTYTGDATTDGSLSVTTGFKPAFLMVKRTDNTGGWVMVDCARNPNNPVNRYSQANVTDVEASGSVFNFTSTGFTLLANLADINSDGGTYVYLAFADTKEYSYYHDHSGNNNDWRHYNLDESKISLDTPNNSFATLSPTIKDGTITLSDGNLYGVGGNSSTGLVGGTFPPLTTGKWYFEQLVTNSNDKTRAGFRKHTEAQNIANQGFAMNTQSAASTSYGEDFGSNGDEGRSDENDVIGHALNLDDLEMKFTKNGIDEATYSISAASAAIGYVPSFYDFSDSGADTSEAYFNFGQDSSFGARYGPANGKTDGNDEGDFVYEPPSGHLAMCTNNLTDSAVTPSEYFNTVLYTGNSSTQSITGVGFQPDFVWIKERSSSSDHSLHDAVRGSTKIVKSSTTAAEITRTASITSFDTDGFSLGDNAGVNEDGETYAAWCWKANGAGSQNTSGSINTTATSASAASGFSIITYSGNGTSGATIGHGLSKAPEFFTVKRRSSSGDDWNTYYGDNTDFLRLNSTAATSDNDAMWNDTSPTSTLISLGNHAEVNSSGETYMCYAWHSVDGYSKIGTYTGNGNADGTFVYTGFRPAWLLVKEITDAGERWFMYDNKRDPENIVQNRLVADANNAETDGASQAIDFLSNGWKARASQDAYNTDAKVYIYLAFAETQQKYSNAR